MKTSFRKLLFFITVLWVFTESAYSEEIATCKDPKGYAYYPHSVFSKEDSGWQEDRITGGVTTLTRLGKNDYDILFIDATKRIVSSKQDGGKVIVSKRGVADVYVIVAYEQTGVIEVYNFFKDGSEKALFTQYTNKGGSAVLIAKSSLLAGECSQINFSLVD